jgi:hypothetical protein
MSEWQPIETAPKDMDIWVVGLAEIWRGSCPFVWQGQAGWSNDDHRWITTSYDDAGHALFIDAEHWMPLPPPPETK